MTSQSCTCSHCGTPIHLQRHDLNSVNQESLRCPKCGGEIIAWNGPHFYTIGITDPKRRSQRVDQEAHDSSV